MQGKKSIAFLAATVFLGVAARGFAEGPLDLAAVRGLAAARSNALASARLGVDAAESTELELARELLPSLQAGASANLSYAMPSGAGGGVSGSLGATQTILDGGRHGIQATIDRLSTADARQAATASLIALESTVDSAYYGVLQSAATLDSATKDLAAAKDRLSLAEARAGLGIDSRSTLLSARAEAAKAETALSQARGGLFSARAALASLTGIDAAAELKDIDVEATGILAARLAALDESGITTTLDKLLAIAHKSNPDLARAFIAADQATKRTELAAKANLPTLSAVASIPLSWSGSTGLATGSASIGLQASIAIAPWSVSAAVKTAGIAAERAGLDGDETRRSLDLSIAQALYSAISAADAIGSEGLALESAESGYEGTLESYKQGAASAADLSTAASSLATARSGLIDARYGFLLDLSKLSALAGGAEPDLLAGLLP